MTNLPIPQDIKAPEIVLPFNGKAVRKNSLVFSFTTFDREHELFNLGNDLTKNEALPNEWFVSLFDKLKEASSKTIQDLKLPPFEYHPVDWKKANAQKPSSSEQLEYWQFRLSKSKGRVIGIPIPTNENTVFYIVWLDAHHNLTNSEGYGKAKYFASPLDMYELLEQKNEELKQENTKLKGDLETAEKLMYELSEKSNNISNS